MRDFARHRVAVAHHRELARIDARRAIFPRLIDADHRCGAPIGLGRSACPAADVLPRRSKVTPSAAAAKEENAIKTPSERPKTHTYTAPQPDEPKHPAEGKQVPGQV